MHRAMAEVVVAIAAVDRTARRVTAEATPLAEVVATPVEGSREAAAISATAGIPAGIREVAGIPAAVGIRVEVITGKSGKAS